MASYRVTVMGTFEDVIEVEADSEDEAQSLAIDEFESTYQVVTGFSVPWDNCEATYIEIEDESID